jgi:hypothetical protein
MNGLVVVVYMGFKLWIVTGSSSTVNVKQEVLQYMEEAHHPLDCVCVSEDLVRTFEFEFEFVGCALRSQDGF